MIKERVVIPPDWLKRAKARWIPTCQPGDLAQWQSPSHDGSANTTVPVVVLDYCNATPGKVWVTIRATGALRLVYAADLAVVGSAGKGSTTGGNHGT